MPRPRRSFSPEFKARVVLELLSGTASQAELCRRHNVTTQLLGHWKATVLEGLPALFGSEQIANQDQQRLADLEQLVGRQALELEILKKASRLLSGPATRNGRSL
jgi:transposase